MPELSPAFALADRAVTELAALDPIAATELGLRGYDHLLTDFSPSGINQRRETAAALIAEAQRTPTTSAADQQAIAVLIERLSNLVALADAGDFLRTLNVLASPPQAIRMAVQLMPDDRETVAQRIGAVPKALQSWREALAEGAQQGVTAAQRQVLAVADQMDVVSSGWFHGHVEGRFLNAPDHLRDLANQADRAYATTAAWLRSDYLPLARERDAVGEQDYARNARAWLGEDIDLAATYAWGWAELRRLTAEMQQEAERLMGRPTDLHTVRDHLEAAAEYQIVGEPELISYLRSVTDEGFAVADQYFDIDPAIRTCEVRIAPSGGAAAPYYTPPADDLSRPGTTWYPTMGKDRYPAWQLRSIWFHEAVPGHHLQLATTIVERQSLSRFQRLMGWTSGYGEGWALYAERLMDEVGAFADPATRLGYLSAQTMRAARVVVDIGLHLELPIPADNGVGLTEQPWNPALAVQFLISHALLDPGFAASEVDRYLGLPGQAISYKVGERVWLELRAEAKDRLGADFNLRDWHMTALRAGHMGLGPFRTLMSGYQR